MFITEAYAQSGGEGGSAFISLLPFIGIMLIMYFLMIRPQQRKARAHREMVAALRRGDTVVTAGGLVAKVLKVRDDDDQVHAEIARGVEVTIIRSTIASVLKKTEPASDAVAR